jgi:predicted PurR-regulated permease PerM
VLRHEPSAAADLTRTTFQLIALGALVASSFLILRPFLAAGSWGVTIAVATWPLLLRTEAWLGGRRGPAVTFMTIVLVLVLLVPFYFGVSAIVHHGKHVAHWSTSLASIRVPDPPAWVESMPAVGTRLATRWRQAAAAGPEEVSARLAPFARAAVVWFVGQVGSLGLLLLQVVLTIVVVAIVYARGETASRGVERFSRRLAGARGEEALDLAVRAVRAVALGVVVTAIVQSIFVAIGLVVAGVPFPAILTAVAFMLSVAQIGPGLVLIPATIWVYVGDGAIWGTGFLVWAVFCGTFDNVLRPMLIRRGADLPLLLIFAGVIGGLIAFGVIGLFIGPVVLAVAYTLLGRWVSEGHVEIETGPGTAGRAGSAAGPA